jgi:DNA repair protein RadD
MILRPYQKILSDDVDVSWAGGARNVLAVLPTGGGKTVLFAEKIKQAGGVRFAIAHRQELVSQISLALAKFGIVHSIQANEKIIKWIISAHIRATGRHFYNAQAHVIVSGVVTLLNRASTLSNAINAAGLWVIDEGHHVLRENVWGKGVALFPKKCKGLGVTATPVRADGKGLGRHSNGVFDTMVEGPGMRDLIHAGFLTDYKIFAPETSIDLSDVPVGKTGDYSRPKLVNAVRKSKIVGDMVEQYLRCAPGKLGVCFVPDVETGEDTAASFKASGVPAAMVHAKTPDKVRQNAVDSLRRGDIKELVNVDIFGEGFDLPAIEVGSFGRPTQSYGLYCQQFGRELRIMDGKPKAIIIDHVGNVMRHGLPDAKKEWTLDAREGRGASKKDPDMLPLKTCFKCTAIYEGYSRTCPFCGYYTEPEGRAGIEQVAGDLFELSAETLAAMRGEVDRVDAPDGSVGDRLRHAGAPDIAIMGAMKNHRLRQEAQGALRGSIAWWAGYQRAAGIADSVSYQMFYARFGIDVMSAQALGRKDAGELNERIKERIGK